MGLLGMLAQGVGQLIGGWAGQSFDKDKENRQFDLQQKMNQQQLELDKQKTDYQTQKQLEMWDKTNYAAQIGQMEKAGLNPALLYGGGGGGGATVGASAASVSSQKQDSSGRMSEGMAMQMGQMAMQQAQIELTKAQTEKTKVEANNISEGGVNNENTKQNTLTGKAQEQLLKTQNDIAAIEREIKDKSQDATIGIIQNTSSKIEAEWNKLRQENIITGETMETQINQAKAQLIKTGLENALLKTNKELGEANIKRISEEIKMGWSKLDIEDRNALSNERNSNTQQARLAWDKLMKDVSESDRIVIEQIGGTVRSILGKGEKEVKINKYTENYITNEK